MKNKIVRGQHHSDGWGYTVLDPKEGMKAQIELGKFKKPKGVSFGHAKNVREKIESGEILDEFRFVLIDYRNGNEQIKKSVMSHQEAWKRNQTLSGTGLAWAKIER